MPVHLVGDLHRRGTCEIGAHADDEQPGVGEGDTIVRHGQ